LVAYLNNAFALRKALFGTNATPKFEYEFTLNPVPNSLIEVTIDGQKIDSNGTGSVKATFPAATATETGVLMNFASASDSTASSTAGPSSSANSANSNVSTKPKFQPSATTPDVSATSLKFPGNWGLFKFVDAGKPAKQAGGDYQLTYSLGGKSVTAVIKPSGGDLFDKNVFKQFKAPQNAVK
jgi:type VI protein secretion system component VasK